MPTRNVVITDHQAEMIERLVNSGEYQNGSEVLREGLRLVEERQAVQQAKLVALREAARIGWADIEAGRYVDFATGEQMSSYFEKMIKRVLEARREE